MQSCFSDVFGLPNRLASLLISIIGKESYKYLGSH